MVGLTLYSLVALPLLYMEVPRVLGMMPERRGLSAVRPRHSAAVTSKRG